MLGTGFSQSNTTLTRIHQGSKNFADRKALRAYTVAH